MGADQYLAHMDRGGHSGGYSDLPIVGWDTPLPNRNITAIQNCRWHDGYNTLRFECFFESNGTLRIHKIVTHGQMWLYKDLIVYQRQITNAMQSARAFDEVDFRSVIWGAPFNCTGWVNGKNRLPADDVTLTHTVKHYTVSGEVEGITFRAGIEVQMSGHAVLKGDIVYTVGKIAVDIDPQKHRQFISNVKKRIQVAMDAKCNCAHYWGS